MSGLKFDGGKPTFDLLPWDALAEVQKVLDFGAQKYAPRNWERGMDWKRPWNAGMRHMAAWVEGQNKDPETGLSHMAHAACCVLFLLAYELRGAGQDSRIPIGYVPPPPANDHAPVNNDGDDDGA